MKILDSTNPWVTLSNVGAVVKIQPNTQGDVPAIENSVLVAVSAHGTISNPSNLLYVPTPSYQNLTLSAMVATDTVTIRGTVFTCVASGATAQQFNVGGTDTLTAVELKNQVNAWFSGINAKSFPIQPGSDDGAVPIPTFEAIGIAGGAGTCTIVIEGSLNGVTWEPTALLTLALTLSTSLAFKVGAVSASAPFYRARLTALTGATPSFKCFMKS